MATALALRSTDIYTDDFRAPVRGSGSTVRRSGGTAVRGPRDGRGGRVRPYGQRPGGRPMSASPAGTACAGMPREPRSVYARRRAWAVGILVGLGLAITVFVVGLVGNGIEQATLPASAQTEVVHVKPGETIGDVAQRVAPTMPSSVVIDKILDLNDLPNAQLMAGQPLLAPVYQR
ncbi:LysM peptidoglycan-binding domain-containing protein [Jongsikchunia kroppenstedtii]|uniref:LysM peptidoglycan-binding domain-containing protein n=1 Tax=Jongsikchunia kroppenstedtii TaxID=1121721 RepID=UPI000370F07A|nr:LysM peptidoglycan-binding domain-containing protein [Jongsikchunia kroppenstedtii]